VRCNVATRHQAGRLKQWLQYLRRRYPEAEETYQRVRTINAPDLLAMTLFGRPLDPVAPPDADLDTDFDEQQDSDSLIAA